ncbi:HD domain-containing protein [Sneathia sanguinegens]|uniref:HD domain-containing protein n=1 Tax=Sneathia sanguinegens TaxID=40543 RepID=UPI00290A940D|nr:HD domain-containing protein [Sneathia sanguinegens]MDU7496736.1 HD domain-containing protein [Sneathia sanguinegens]
MNKYELALKIATEAHKGQVDKAGVPYINHPLTVASLVDTEEEKIVALLHDTIEDTNITEQDLLNYGFSNKIVEAVKLLTHNKNVPYMDYVAKIKDNELARKVKIADLTHNSDLSRLKEITEKDKKRYEKYQKALLYLS